MVYYEWLLDKLLDKLSDKLLDKLSDNVTDGLYYNCKDTLEIFFEKKRVVYLPLSTCLIISSDVKRTCSSGT